jgi:hypothetical protein
VLRVPLSQARLPMALPAVAVKSPAVAAARVETERADLVRAGFELAVLVHLPSSQEQAAPPASNCQANSNDERDRHELT